MSAVPTPTASTAGNDPLMRRIMSEQLTQSNGGVTGSVRIGSGEAITLVGGASLNPLFALKPAPGLAVKPAKAQPRKKARRAEDQLKTLSAEERRADDGGPDAGRSDWSGR